MATPGPTISNAPAPSAPTAAGLQTTSPAVGPFVAPKASAPTTPTPVSGAPYSTLSQSGAPMTRLAPSVITAQPAQQKIATMQQTLADTKAGLQKQSQTNAAAAAEKQKADQAAAAQKATEDATKALSGPQYGYVGGTKVELDANGQPVGGTAPTSTATTTETPSQTPVDTLNKQITDNVNKLDTAYNDYNTRIDQISRGTFPLSPSQQSLVDSTKALLQQAHDAQVLANKNYTAGITQAGISAGLERYAPQMYAGEIKGSIDQGLSKLATLDAQGAQELAKLQQSFDEQNYKNATDAFDAFNKITSEKNSTLEHLADAAQAHLKDVRDFTDKVAQEQIANERQAKQDTYNQVQKPIDDIAAEAAKYGAPKSVLDAISKSGDVGAAISAATGYLQDPTSLGGMYNSYVNNLAPGKTPMSPADFVAAQKYADALATERASSAFAYQKAYAAASAKAAVDAMTVGGDKNQQKLEKDYSQTLLKELSNRSGGLGLQDQKVNQAIHLKSLIDQYTTTDSKGNKVYNIPTAQYAELVLGLANMLSASGTTSDADRQNLMSKTSAGDLRGAIQYITGTPQTGNTQEIIKNLVDSIDRQGRVAEGLRDQDVAFLHGLAPTDLDPDRRAALEKNLLPSYINPQQNVEQAAEQADNTLKAYTAAHPEKAQDMAKAEQALKQQLGVSSVPATTFLQYFPEFGQGFNKPLSMGENGSEVKKIADAIGQHESGGNYKAIGPDTGSGDRAIGKYQVMASNVPAWTKEVLGKAMTPEQFRNDPEAQDAVARYKMGQYYDQYGNLDDVATAWFAGPGAVGTDSQAQDVTGTSVPQYIQSVRNIYNQLA